MSSLNSTHAAASQIQSPEKATKQRKRIRLPESDEEEPMEEEEKTMMVDHHPTVASSSATVATHSRLSVKKVKLGSNESDWYQSQFGPDTAADEALDAEVAKIESVHHASQVKAKLELMAARLSPRDDEEDDSKTRVKNVKGKADQALSPFKDDAIPPLLDAAMELGDSALCYQFSTLLCMKDPQLNLNSKSLIYGDTVGMRLFHLLQRYSPHVHHEKQEEAEEEDDDDDVEARNDRAFRKMWGQIRSKKVEKFTAARALFDDHWDRIRSLCETIDPHLTNRQGQTVLHVIADATLYSPLPKLDRSSSLPVQLLFSLIQSGANLLARDHAGKVVIIEMTRNHSLIGLEMEELIAILFSHNPVELLNATNNDGDTLLRVSGYLTDQSVLLNELAAERDVFRQIEFCDTEFDLLQLQAENDASRTSFISDPGFRPYQPRADALLSEVERYQRIQSAIEDWIEFNRPARRLMLDPYLIPDLASIVTDYWIGCESREPTILIQLEQGTDRQLHHDSKLFVMELSSSERTIKALWAKVLTTISRSSRRGYFLRVNQMPIKTDEDVQALTTGEKMSVIYRLVIDDENQGPPMMMMMNPMMTQPMNEEVNAYESDSGVSWQPSSASSEESDEDESPEEMEED